MKQLFFLLGFLIIAIASSAQQKLSKPTSLIVKAIETINKYESQYVGFAGSPSEQFKNFQNLKKKATETELRSLLSHKNPVVRIYCFMALRDKNLALAKKESKRLLRDNESFSTLEGCFGGSETVETFVRRALISKD